MLRLALCSMSVCRRNLPILLTTKEALSTSSSSPFDDNNNDNDDLPMSPISPPSTPISPTAAKDSLNQQWIKGYQVKAKRFYENFNAMNFLELEGLLSEAVILKDHKRGNFVGKDEVIPRLKRVRTKHGEEPWTVGVTEVFLNIPATRTRLQFRSEETKTLITVLTSLTFDDDKNIEVIVTERIGAEPI
eukprot:TRINITY_DN29031_c0_g1_i1.p1 TRINITY_DN29031_c0_g1~~TRINITY_DN29031_c0_g1_i1.p1  ORF type:complete len:189 (-),score=39.88 TRINITY_DN29031_c0_g1_i1:54-620(-)